MTPDPHYLQAELETLIRQDPKIWEFLRAGSLDGVWYWDLENPSHEYMSPEFWQLFGFDPATKRHDPAEWQDLIHPDDLKAATDRLGQHLENADIPYDQVVRYTCADGSTAWVRCRGIAIRDKTGTPIRLLGAHNDMTALKNQEAAAATARDELEAIFHAATSGIVALNRDGVIVRINHQARHMLGGISALAPLDWPETIQFLEAETMTPLEASADPVKRALSGHALKNETHLMRRATSETVARYVRVNAAAMDVEASGIQTVLIIDDVSVEERNRQVVERKGRLDALGQLTGGIAHDFNNVLASQLYAIDLARNTDDPDKRANYLDIAARSIERGRRLTSRLLSFARRQPGLRKVGKTHDTLTEFEKLIRPMLEAQIDLVIEPIDPKLHHYCDQTQLETALLNVVLNARDAMLVNKKGKTITISARALDLPLAELETNATGTARVEPKPGEKQRFVEINISDNGPGMDDETLARCTDPFFTTKDVHAGTGLGLAMVYGFLRQSDGDLRIYSEQGLGTNVQMVLPRGTKTGEREAPMPADTLLRGQGQTVLLVEDEAQLLDMMRDVLTDLGYHVVSADTGQAAIDLHRAGEAFDLLLTDVVMPGTIGGFELARWMRERRPDLPVLYMSGYAGFTAQEMGTVQAPLLQKPTLPVDLAKAVSLALETPIDG